MSTFSELINQLDTIKKECIVLAKQLSEIDEQIHSMIDETSDNIECSLDLCRYPNREVQIPLSRIYTEEIINNKNEELITKVIQRFNNFKSAFELASQRLTFLINKNRKLILELEEQVYFVKMEIDRIYPKYKETINIIEKSISIVIEGIDIEEFRQKEYKDPETLNEFRKLLSELKKTMDTYNINLNKLSEDSLEVFKIISTSGNCFSNFIEFKIFGKIKELVRILNGGFSKLQESSKYINIFNKEILLREEEEVEDDINKEKKEKYDKILTDLLDMTRKIDTAIYNTSKEIETDYNVLEENISKVKDNIDKKSSPYDESLNILIEYGNKIIDIVNEIRKLFDKGPAGLKLENINIKFPFNEYGKRLNRGLEKIKEMKEELKKPIRLVRVILDDQINQTTLDLLFIMDITDSMQDLLDETRDSIKYILDKINKDIPGIDVRFAFEGYRDFSDIKEGQKYYTIDFETNLEIFKSELDEIKALGGGDDAEDVAGGLDAGLNMSWKSNARYAILIADAPGHGKKYHSKDVEDHYEDGDPNGLTLEQLMEKYVDNNINLCLTRISEYTDKMFDLMIKAYEAKSKDSKEKPKIEVFNYKNEDEFVNVNDKKYQEQKRTMGNLVAETAIEIYHLYSAKVLEEEVPENKK